MASSSPPSRFVDLHSHSTASDGSRSPADVVREARRVGLVALALTDHDTVDGLEEARRAGEELAVRIVPGVELSAVEPAGETHLLGLHLADTSELEERLRSLRTMRRDRAVRIVQRLNELGVRISLEDVLAQASGSAIGRPHVARALVGAGWATDVRDAFGRYLGDGRAAFIPKEQLPISEAIAMIHRAGGLAVLAHPGASGTRERIEALVALGLDGVEVRHPSHAGADITRLMALVDHFRLVPSGGSDWHGLAEGNRTLGSMQVPHAWLERQEARLASRSPTGGDPQANVA